MSRSKILIIVLCFIIISNISKSENTNSGSDNKFLNTSEIRIRDPFILADKNTKMYYLYASISNRTRKESEGVEVYTSKDLVNWTKPKTVFKVPADFWATKWVWAPEVHFYNGKYYLFATFTSNDLLENPGPNISIKDWPPYNKRGTQILISDNPYGPFKPFSNKPHTPLDLMTLDGTLWVEGRKPYMIYCHEWVQIEDGTIDLVALKKDLSATDGKAKTIVKASDAPWIKPIAEGRGYITDGCYIYKTKNDKLIMIWSSIGNDGYTIGMLKSESGKISGPWQHLPNRLFKKDGGHGMTFKTFEGKLIVVLHQPNSEPNERMQLYELKDTGDELELGEKLFQ